MISRCVYNYYYVNSESVGVYENFDAGFVFE